MLPESTCADRENSLRGVPAALGRWSGLIALALLVGSGEAAIFVRLDGAPGDSVDADHQGWIDVHGVQQSHGPPGSRVFSHGGFLLMRKRLDKSSPKLAEAAIQSSSFPELEMEFARSEGVSSRFFHVSLRDVSVFNYRAEAGADGPSEETVILLFDWAEWTYVEADTAGRPLATHKAYWDFVRNVGGSETEKLGFVVPATHAPGEGLRIEWEAEAGRAYELLGTTDLSQPFQPVQSISPGAAGTRTLELPSTGSFGFYYLTELPE